MEIERKASQPRVSSRLCCYTQTCPIVDLRQVGFSMACQQYKLKSELPSYKIDEGFGHAHVDEQGCLSMCVCTCVCACVCVRVCVCVCVCSLPLLTGHRETRTSLSTCQNYFRACLKDFQRRNKLLVGRD